MLLAQVTLDNNVSIGNILTLAFVIIAGAFVYFRTKKDVEIDTVRMWIQVHEKAAEGSEARLRITENAVIQLTAIQESFKDHINAVDRRLDRVEEQKDKT